MNDQIRRALLERLQTVGVAPDLKNDDAAVKAVCDTLGLDRATVVDELLRMRAEAGRKMMQRLGGKQPLTLGLLTMLSASRDNLVRQINFDEAYRRRAQQEWSELIEDLDLGEMMPVERFERAVA